MVMGYGLWVIEAFCWLVDWLLVMGYGLLKLFVDCWLLVVG